MRSDPVIESAAPPAPPSPTRPTLATALLRGLHRWHVAAVRNGRARPPSLYRYQLPPSLPWAGSAGRLHLPLDRVTTSAGFAFGQAGWHPHVETLRWLAETPDPDPADSPLARLYDAFAPRTVREAVLDDYADPVPGLSEVPLVRGQLRELWNARGPRPAGPLDQPGLYWGPATREQVADEIQRTVRVHDSLAAHGHRDQGPGKYAISGYLLVRGDDYRFVIHQGHHRLAALTTLGYASTPVYLSPKTYPVIEHDRLKRWTQGPRARYSLQAAEALFGRLFDSTGQDKAARLGLLRAHGGRARAPGGPEHGLGGPERDAETTEQAPSATEQTPAATEQAPGVTQRSRGATEQGG